MSNATAEEEEKQSKQLPQCGRLVFRGVELAYLNIDGEYMMPLAELLALVLPSTPRTTLFTRMEKMKVRRHFCQPEEIKLLKTVNGIHGSSANCTLLSKTEVDKYCSIYVDKPNESHTPTTINLDGVESKDSAKENVTEVREVMKSPQNNNANSSKLAVLHKHKRSPPFKAKLKLTKLAKAKKLRLGFSRGRDENQTVTGGEDLLNIDGNFTYGSCNGCVQAFLPDSSQHMTNSTQTVSMLNRSAKKRAKKRDQVGGNETNQTHGKKRALRDADHERPVQSPLKIPKMSELNGRKEIDKDGKTSQFPCSLKKSEFDGLISDSSSNDSGLGSSALSNPSTPTKSDFLPAAGELNGLLKKDEQTIKEHTSMCKVKIETPKRRKPKEIEGNSLTLSPPALLLKRYENSWQVQQKIDEGTRYSAQKREVETKKSTRPVRLAPAFDLCLSASQSFSEKKQSKKKRKSRKSLSDKGEVRIKSQATTDVITESGELEIETKKNLKQTLKGKSLLAEETLFKNLNSPTGKKKEPVEVSRESTREGKQLELDKLAKEERLKQEAVLDKLAEDALAKYFIAPSSKPSSSITEPKKPKVTTKTAVSKKNYNFELLTLFPVTSPLTLHGGALGPSFTVSFPSGTQPSASHPLWKWTLGGPVDRSTQKTVKKPAAQRTEPQSSKTTSKRMPILKKRKRKLSAFRKALSSTGKDFSSRSAFSSGQSISTTDFAKKSASSAETCVSFVPI